MKNPTERILTLHPQGKHGVSINGEKYTIIKSAIKSILTHTGEIDFSDLLNKVKKNLEGTFTSSINWYVTTEKLDLEAGREIVRARKYGGQVLSLADEGKA